MRTARTLVGLWLCVCAWSQQYDIFVGVGDANVEGSEPAEEPIVFSRNDTVYMFDGVDNVTLASDPLSNAPLARNVSSPLLTLAEAHIPYLLTNRTILLMLCVDPNATIDSGAWGASSFLLFDCQLRLRRALLLTGGPHQVRGILAAAGQTSYSIDEPDSTLLISPFVTEWLNALRTTSGLSPATPIVMALPPLGFVNRSAATARAVSGVRDACRLMTYCATGVLIYSFTNNSANRTAWTAAEMRTLGPVYYTVLLNATNSSTGWKAAAPFVQPTAEPTPMPSASPTALPTLVPSAVPTRTPTGSPSAVPTAEPTPATAPVTNVLETGPLIGVAFAVGVGTAGMLFGIFAIVDCARLAGYRAVSLH